MEKCASNSSFAFVSFSFITYVLLLGKSKDTIVFFTDSKVKEACLKKIAKIIDAKDFLFFFFCMGPVLFNWLTKDYGIDKDCFKI